MALLLNAILVSTFELTNLLTYQLFNLPTFELTNLSTYQLFNLPTFLRVNF